MTCIDQVVFIATRNKIFVTDEIFKRTIHVDKKTITICKKNILIFFTKNLKNQIWLHPHWMIIIERAFEAYISIRMVRTVFSVVLFGCVFVWKITNKNCTNANWFHFLINESN